MKRTSSRLVVCGILAGCAATAGCSASATDPIRFNDPPAWTHEDIGLDAVSGGAIRGDTVIVAGRRDGRSRLVVTDAGSGAARWSIAEHQVLPGGDDLRVHREYPGPFTGSGDAPVIVDDGEDWSVIVGYEKVDPDSGTGADPTAWGVAALSGEDGSLEWARPLTRPGEDDETKPNPVIPVAADGNTVVAAPRNGPRTFAVNAETGENLWKHEGIWPYSVTRDVVIGQKAKDDDALWVEDGSTGGPVYGWDAKSGEKLWKAGGTGDHLGLELATDSMVLVADTDGGRVLDPESGRRIGESGDWGGDCVVDAASGDRFACSNVSDGTLAVGTMADGEVTIAENTVISEREDFSVTGMYDGRIFIDSDDGSATHKGRYLVDADAEVIAKDVPGRPAAISKGHALFLSGEEDRGYPEAGLYEVAKS